MMDAVEAITAHRGLGGRAVRWAVGVGLDPDDAEQELSIALWEASSRFDPAIGAWSSIAVPTIFGRMGRAVASADANSAVRRPYHARRQLAAAIRASDDEAAAVADVAETPEEEAARLELPRLVREAVARLAPAERAAITSIYLDNLGLMATARRLRRSPQGVNEARQRGLAKLRRWLAHLDRE